MELALVIFLIFLNGIFALSEMALVSSKKARLQQLVDKGSIGAAKAISLKESPAYFISTIQAGITIIGILNGIVGEKALVEPTTQMIISLGLVPSVAHTIASIAIIVFLTFLTVVFGEIIPKQIGLILPEKMASILSIPMFWLSKVCFPIVWLFKQSSECMIKLFGLHNIKQDSVSNEEVKELMEQGADAGIFHESEQQIVANVLHMDEKSVESIMTHRGDLFCIDITDDFDENLQKIIDNNYSRIIIINEDKNNILGVMHVTTILPLIQKNQRFDFQHFMEPPLYVPETIMGTQVLEKFRETKTEMAVVVNEYGENIGIVTLVDIMQAIVGNIGSEEDEDNEEISMLEDGTILANGSIFLEKLAHHFDLEELPAKEGLNTLAGLMMEQAGAISGSLPTEGFKCKIELKEFDLDFEVIDMKSNKVTKVKIVKIQHEPLVLE